MSLQAPLVQRQLTRLLLKSDGICWTIRPPATAAAMASAALTDTEFRSQLQPEGKRIGFRMSSKNKLEDVGGSNGSPLFSVMIVNYNGGDYLQNCISSLAQQTFRDFEVICIDNASSDGSVDVLDTEGVPNFTLSRQSENLGFARGNNVAATQARGRWLALLNPDAIADPYWLQKIFEASERHTACRVFACGQIKLDDPNMLDGAGDAYLIFGVPWRGGFELPASELPKEGMCFSPCGASAIYERNLYLEFKGFDERFFCYCEDVDLGYRMQLSGEQCIFLPDALIQHKGSGTSGRYSYFTTFHGNRNRTWTYLKNTPLLLLVLTLPGHLALLCYIYFRNRKTLPNTGMRDGIREGFKEGWKLRQKSQHWKTRRKVSLWHLSKTMAFNPFMMARRAVHVRPLK